MLKDFSHRILKNEKYNKDPRNLFRIDLFIIVS